MNRPSFRAAVDAKCKSCIYDPLSRGTWREQVAQCTSSNCPLHPIRPMPLKRAETGGEDEEGIDAAETVETPVVGEFPRLNGANHDL